MFRKFTHPAVRQKESGRVPIQLNTPTNMCERSFCLAVSDVVPAKTKLIAYLRVRWSRLIVQGHPHVLVRSNLETWTSTWKNHNPDHWVLENEQVKLADGGHIAGSPFALLVSSGPASARSSVCDNCQEAFSTGNFSLNSTKLLRLTAR